MKGEQSKLCGLRRHSFSVRHLLFYCNLMALLSPGASRQSPLYHMAIIFVALLCDSLSHVTPYSPSRQQWKEGVDKRVDQWAALRLQTQGQGYLLLLHYLLYQKKKKNLSFRYTWTQLSKAFLYASHKMLPPTTCQLECTGESQKYTACVKESVTYCSKSMCKISPLVTEASLIWTFSCLTHLLWIG